MYIGLDLETTGVNPSTCDILEIALVGVNANLDVQFAFQSYVQTELAFDLWKEASAINGITPEMLVEAPRWPDIQPAVAFLLALGSIVGHNVKGYDLKILANKGVKAEFKDGRDIDTMLSLKDGGGRWQKLTKLAGQYEIPTEGAHSALDDVWMSLKVARAAGLIK